MATKTQNRQAKLDDLTDHFLKKELSFLPLNVDEHPGLFDEIKHRARNWAEVYLEMYPDYSI